ncbi:transmembrane protein, putative, partial [Bodo saltans]
MPLEGFAERRYTKLTVNISTLPSLMPLCLVTFLVSLLSVSVHCGTIREHGQLTLNSNEYTLQSSVTDGTYLYFVADALTGYGKMVRVNPTTFTRSASVTGSTTGTNYWRCVAQSGGYAYVGTFEAPANLLQITLATMTIANTLSLSSYSLNYATTVQIVGSYAYFATYESSPSIVRIAIPGFTYSTSTTISSSYCQYISSSGQYDGYLFFTCYMAPGRLMRFDYASMA